MFTRHLLVLLMVPSITGCAVIGPASIRGGRMAYNDAIVATEDQQVLAMIVRMRYMETTGLLAVTSVTANMQIAANAGSEFGIGEDSSYAGNLVPLSVGVAYEENPTISYVPVQGEQYMREFLSPLPLDITVLLFNALHDSPHTMTLLLRSINGIQNPGFLTAPSHESDPRFAQIVEILAEWGREGRAIWAPQTSGFILAILNEQGDITPRVREFFGLLGMTATQDFEGVTTLPVYLGLGKPDQPAIHLNTRSLWDLFQIASASVDVPAAHVESGVVPPLPVVGPAGDSFHVRSSTKRPAGALTAVQHRGWWYYIDGTDTTSKMTFRIIKALMSARIADTVDHRKSTPVLTVPVSQ